MPEQHVERGATGALVTGPLPGRSNLTENFGLPDHGGVDPCGDGEQVVDGVVVVVDVQVIAELLGRYATSERKLRMSW
jgi:hypothetical protein